MPTTVQPIICRHCHLYEGVDRVLGEIVGGTCIVIKRKHTQFPTNTYSTIIAGSNFNVLCGFCMTVSATTNRERKEELYNPRSFHQSTTWISTGTMQLQ